MLRFTFSDGTFFFIAPLATVTTNFGPKQADQVVVGDYIRCGTKMFCPIEFIVSV